MTSVTIEFGVVNDERNFFHILLKFVLWILGCS